MRTKILGYAIAVLAAGGLAVSGYLYTRSILLVLGRAGAMPDVCSMVFGATGCDATLSIDAFTFLGLPVAGWGLVYFGGVGMLLFLGYLLGGDNVRATAIASLAIGAGGLGVSVYLIAQFVAGEAPWCPLCVVVHATNAALIVALFFWLGMPLRSIAASMGRGVRFAVAGNPAGAADPPSWKTLVMFAGLLTGVVIYQATLVRYERAKTEAANTPPAPRLILQYLTSDVFEIPVHADDPLKGHPAAPLRFVVFSDFQCTGCKLLARRLDKLMEKYPDSMSVVFRHFPLDTACNAALNKQVHELACRAALDAEAARRGGRFWEFHDAVYGDDYPLTAESLRASEAALSIATESGGLSQEDLARVQRDIQLGLSLGVDSTPAVFLNGRRIAEPTERALELLAMHALGVETAVRAATAGANR